LRRVRHYCGIAVRAFDIALHLGAGHDTVSVDVHIIEARAEIESAGRFQFTDRLVTVPIERLEEAHVAGSPAAIILGLVLRARARSAGYQQQQDRNLRESSKHY